MKSKLVIFLTLALTLLMGSHETTLSFGLIESSAMERSEESPLRESEEHTEVITSRVFRPLVFRPGLNDHIPHLIDLDFHKLVTNHCTFFKSSLHILFLSLRN